MNKMEKILATVMITSSLVALTTDYIIERNKPWKEKYATQIMIGIGCLSGLASSGRVYYSILKDTS